MTRRFTITTQGNFKTSNLLVVKEFLKKNTINSEKLGITSILFIHLFSQQGFIEHLPCASLVLGTRKPQYMEQSPSHDVHILENQKLCCANYGVFKERNTVWS